MLTSLQSSVGFHAPVTPLVWEASIDEEKKFILFYIPHISEIYSQATPWEWAYRVAELRRPETLPQCLGGTWPGEAVMGRGRVRLKLDEKSGHEKLWLWMVWGWWLHILWGASPISWVSPQRFSDPGLKPWLEDCPSLLSVVAAGWEQEIWAQAQWTMLFP